MSDHDDLIPDQDRSTGPPSAGFVRVFREMTHSPAFLHLSPAAQGVLLEFLDRWDEQTYNRPEVNSIPFSWSNSRTNASRNAWDGYRTEIAAKGFLEPTHAPGAGVYRLSEKWKIYSPSRQEQSAMERLKKRKADRYHSAKERRTLTPHGPKSVPWDIAQNQGHGGMAQNQGHGPWPKNGAVSSDKETKRDSDPDIKDQTGAVGVGEFISNQPNGKADIETPEQVRAKKVDKILTRTGDKSEHAAWWMKVCEDMERFNIRLPLSHGLPGLIDECRKVYEVRGEEMPARSDVQPNTAPSEALASPGTCPDVVQEFIEAAAKYVKIGAAGTLARAIHDRLSPKENPPAMRAIRLSIENGNPDPDRERMTCAVDITVDLLEHPEKCNGQPAHKVFTRRMRESFPLLATA